MIRSMKQFIHIYELLISSPTPGSGVAAVWNLVEVPIGGDQV